MRLLVCGDRNWSDAETIDRVLTDFVGVLDLVPNDAVEMIVTGGASGADTLAIQWSVKHGIPTRTFMAEWKKYGKAAGPIRNEQMLKFGVNFVIAFHPDIDKSKGTKDMIQRARKAGIPTRIVIS
jgi:hypothetical protein